MVPESLRYSAPGCRSSECEHRDGPAREGYGIADVKTPNFTETERRVAETALRERYKTALPVEPIEAEMRLDPDSPVLTSCPALYWSARGAHFVVVKLASERFRSQFFYRDDQHYWTGRPEYESLIDCMLDILRAQADHERERHGVASGASGGDFAEGKQ
jgi:hypothetical protein